MFIRQTQENKAMKFLRKGLLLLFLLPLFISCFEDDDDNLTTDQGALASEIHDFIWKGMNVVYLYKPNIPNLANDRFSTDQQYADYLNSYDNAYDYAKAMGYKNSASIIANRKVGQLIDNYYCLSPVKNIILSYI